MNLIDFELHLNPSKVQKGLTTCRVVELTAKEYTDQFGRPHSEWKAVVTPGMYKVKVITSGEVDLHIAENRCNCNNRKYADYCEHSIALMFWLRHITETRPALDVMSYQITKYDKELRSELKSLLDDDLGLARRDIHDFTESCNEYFDHVEKALQVKSYKDAVELALGAYKGLHRMVEYVWPDSMRINSEVRMNTIM